MTTCAREGCRRPAKGDEFCSTYCAKRARGLITPLPPGEWKKTQRAVEQLKDRYGSHVEVENVHTNRAAAPGRNKNRAKRFGTAGRVEP